MSDPEKKQKLFYNRAQHQLREIEFSCREVVTLSQNIKIMGGDISDGDINCKKIEFIKTEIKEKLKAMAAGTGKVAGLKELAAKLPGDLPASAGKK